MEMKMRLQIGATLALALGWILGNASPALAHGGGGGGRVALAGYAMYGVFLIGGYFFMYWEIPQRVTHLFMGRSDKKSELSKPDDRTRAGMESKGD